MTVGCVSSGYGPISANRWHAKATKERCSREGLGELRRAAGPSWEKSGRTGENRRRLPMSDSPAWWNGEHRAVPGKVAAVPGWLRPSTYSKQHARQARGSVAVRPVRTGERRRRWAPGRERDTPPRAAAAAMTPRGVVLLVRLPEPFVLDRAA